MAPFSFGSVDINWWRMEGDARSAGCDHRHSIISVRGLQEVSLSDQDNVGLAEGAGSR